MVSSAATSAITGSEAPVLQLTDMRAGCVMMELPVRLDMTVGDVLNTLLSAEANTGLSLVNTSHVTSILASDWSTQANTIMVSCHGTKGECKVTIRILY